MERLNKGLTTARSPTCSSAASSRRKPSPSTWQRSRRADSSRSAFACSWWAPRSSCRVNHGR
eukprot:1149649-Prorocentrum_minimum.AAC.1